MLLLPVKTPKPERLKMRTAEGQLEDSCHLCIPAAGMAAKEREAVEVDGWALVGVNPRK